MSIKHTLTVVQSPQWSTNHKSLICTKRIGQRFLTTAFWPLALATIVVHKKVWFGRDRGINKGEGGRGNKGGGKSLPPDNEGEELTSVTYTLRICRQQR